jgi:hypothetical protein
MKEPVMITCPYCRKETPAAAICRNCGKELDSLNGLEVQYRDFKGSEMLDIKMSPHPRQEEKQTAQKGNEDAGNGLQPEEQRKGKKTVFFFWAAIVIIFSALVWYYLLKFLLGF